MYRSDLRIEIDGEDISSSASCAYVFEEHFIGATERNILRGLKTGLSMVAIVALVNTVSTGDALAMTKAAPSAITEKGHDLTSYQVFAEIVEDKMSDDEFSRAMAALEDIWRACPKDLPNDLSLKHDHYLFGAKG